MMQNSLKIPLFLVLVLSICLCINQSYGQSAAPEQSSETSADDAFTDLRDTFNLLSKSLANKRGIADIDRPIIQQLRERLDAYALNHPRDPRPLAASMTLSTWLQETDSADALMEKLLQLVPDNTFIVLQWARRLQAQSRYDEAITMLERAKWDRSSDALTALMLAGCYQSENRFNDAITVITELSEESTSSDPSLKNRVETALQANTKLKDLWELEQDLRRKEAADNDLPRIEFLTSQGRIVVELFENEAPNTVANFITLVEAGFYDEMPFHRIVSDFMSQVGDPRSRESSNATGDDAGYRIPDEHLTEPYRKHFAGSVSMANKSTPNSGGSQFFFNHKPTQWLNGKHTVFGRILEGLDVARRVKQDTDKIIQARVLRKRSHDYSFTKATDALPPALEPPTKIPAVLPVPPTTEPSSGSSKP